MSWAQRRSSHSSCVLTGACGARKNSSTISLSILYSSSIVVRYTHASMSVVHSDVRPIISDRSDFRNRVWDAEERTGGVQPRGTACSTTAFLRGFSVLALSSVRTTPAATASSGGGEDGGVRGGEGGVAVRGGGGCIPKTTAVMVRRRTVWHVSILSDPASNPAQTSGHMGFLQTVAKKMFSVFRW